MPRQQWEYARIVWHSAQYAKDEWMDLVYYHPAGNKSEELTAGTFKKVDFRDQFRVWITRLGQEGYEMVGVTPVVYQPSTYVHYWFKRPL